MNSDNDNGNNNKDDLEPLYGLFGHINDRLCEEGIEFQIEVGRNKVNESEKVLPKLPEIDI